MKAISLAASLIVACIGALVLVGWMGDIAALKNVLPGLVAMKADTAIGLLLSGAAMALLVRKPRGTGVQFVTGILAVAVAAIGALTLSEYFFGLNLGIDQWMFHEAPDTVWTSQPGRMAPVSAFCFMLLGGGIVAAAQPLSARLRLPLLTGLGAALAVMGAISLAGCLAEVLFKAAAWNDSGLAVHTAFAFLLLGCVLIALALDERRFDWSLDKLVTVGFIFAIAVMLLAAGVSYNFTLQLRVTASWVAHRQEVLKEIGNAAGGMANLESAQRGYVILGDEKLLEGQDDAKAAVMTALDSLLKLASDNPAQQSRIRRLQALVPQRFAFADATIVVDERPGPLNLKQKEYIGDVLNSANHLLQLINDVLDLAKVEAGKFGFQPEQFELARAMDEVCAVVKGAREPETDSADGGGRSGPPRRGARRAPVQANLLQPPLERRQIHRSKRDRPIRRPPR